MNLKTTCLKAKVFYKRCARRVRKAVRTSRAFRRTKVLGRRIIRRRWRPVWRWCCSSWRENKCRTLIILLAALIFGALTFFGPICWFCSVLKWLIYDGVGSAQHGYIIMMLWLAAASGLGFILAQTYNDKFRQKIAIPFQRLIAPEFPMRGIILAISVGCLFVMIGLVSFPETLRIFGWLHGGRIAAIPYFATISALAITPVTALVWYWRHLYKKREREHGLLTLAITSLINKDSPSVRITGLYTLKELVEANPAKLIDVMNILCGFLKHRYHEEEKVWHKQGHDCQKFPKIDSGRAPDIREALNVFSEIWQSRFDEEEKYRISMEFAGNDHLDTYYPDLQEVNFQQSNLNELCLQKVNLANSNLQGVTLFAAKLQGANLRNANLQGADLWGARLQGAKIWEANLLGANLSGAYLQGASLQVTKLQGTDFSGAHLQGAHLQRSKLRGADLSRARLQGANLTEAEVEGVNFESAQLHGVTDHYNMPGFLAYRVGRGTEISQGMRERTYSKSSIQPTIDKLQKISKETSDYCRAMIGLAIDRLQENVDEPPKFPEMDSSEYCGELTCDMVLKIIKEYPKEMQQKELKKLKEVGKTRGFDVPDRL